MTLKRVRPLSGIVFVVLTIVAFGALGGSTPDVNASPAKVTGFYAEHHSAQTAAAYVLMIAVAFLVLFASSLWAVVADAERTLWSAVFVIGSAVAAAGFLVAAGLHLALSDGVHGGIAPVAAQALNALDARDYLAFSGGVGIMLVGAAGMLVPRSGVYRVLGWAGLVIGVAIFTPAGFFAFLAAGLWILAAGLVLTVGSTADVAVPAEGVVNTLTG